MTNKEHKLVSSVPLDEGQRKRIQAIIPDIEIQDSKHFLGEAVGDLLTEDTTILYGFRVPDDLLDRSPNLHWLQLLGAGCEHLAGSPIMNGSVSITTASGIHATPIAEYVLGTMLGFYRWIFQADRAQMRGQWVPQGEVAMVSRELRRKTIGIIGYGSIGREVARLAKPFGTRIVAVKRDPATPEDSGYVVPGTGDPEGTIPDAMYGTDDLLSILPECDVVVLAVPSTSATKQLLGEEELSAMKAGSYLINIARGDVVDEAALARILDSRHLAGAALDVFEEEPLAPDSPFWSMDNVLVTPHISGASRAHLRRMFELFADNLERFDGDQPLLNLVNSEYGY
ncbi:MAG: D-2-hydroxyacid dehydrogenase [Candidatus Hydrogenedentota bacterium]